MLRVSIFREYHKGSYTGLSVYGPLIKRLSSLELEIRERDLYHFILFIAARQQNAFFV